MGEGEGAKGFVGRFLWCGVLGHLPVSICITPCVSCVARDTTIINHSRSGSYGEGSLEAHIWQEEEEVVQATRRCQDMEYT